MENSSQKMEYEKAGRYRDQIQTLQQIQTKQIIDTEHGSADIIGISLESGVGCIEVFFLRNGTLIGRKNFFQKINLNETIDELLIAFLSQFYVGNSAKRDFPKKIIIPFEVNNISVIQDAIVNLSSASIKIQMSSHRKDSQQWLSMAKKNATQSLINYLANKKTVLQRFIALKEMLFLSDTPRRIECFDISHTQGENTVASCVVFSQNGPQTDKYRRFNIRQKTHGDDCAALKEAVERRYKKSTQPDAGYQNDSIDKYLPDILLIDGGKGQMNSVKKALDNIHIKLNIFGISKGENRKVGLETIINMQTGETFDCDLNNPGFLLLLQIRDEAHRFAIVGHRKQRDKKRRTSTLEEIEGVGSKRRANLIKFFGGLQGIKKASAVDIAKVHGISHDLANKIYDTLHN